MLLRRYATARPTPCEMMKMNIYAKMSYLLPPHARRHAAVTPTYFTRAQRRRRQRGSAQQRQECASRAGTSARRMPQEANVRRHINIFSCFHLRSTPHARRRLRSPPRERHEAAAESRSRWRSAARGMQSAATRATATLLRRTVPGSAQGTCCRRAKACR